MIYKNRRKKKLENNNYIYREIINSNNDKYKKINLKLKKVE